MSRVHELVQGKQLLYLDRRGSSGQMGLLTRTDDPALLGLSAAAVDRAVAAVSAAATLEVHGGVLGLARGTHVLLRPFGVQPPGQRGEPGGESVGAEDVFLVASLTKPVTCTAVLQLAERDQLGQHGLDSLAHPLLPPNFLGAWDGVPGPAAAQQREWRRELTLRHLLTHSSGLPDGLPNEQNLEYRRRHAPLSVPPTSPTHPTPSSTESRAWLSGDRGLMAATGFHRGDG